ncbi:MAG: FlgD immunoglobulin-like domain containing protein [bacterium]
MNRAMIQCAAAVTLLMMPALLLAQPNITSISPAKTSANTGATVNIYGTGFGSLADLVYFPDHVGDHVVNPEAVIAGGVRVRVPPTWSGDVFIQANGVGAWSNGVNHDISYNYSQTKWFSLPFTWYLNSNGAAGCTYNNTRDAVVGGYNAWSCASGLSTTFGGSTTTSTTAQDGENVQHWRNAGWNPGTVAVTDWWYVTATGEIVEADIAYNSQHYTWSCSGAAGDMDVQHIATHEEGHSIGLLDLYGDADVDETMYGWVDNGETHNRTLHTDDALGVEYMYSHSRANFTATTPSGWYSPLVPRNSGDATSSYAPLPSTLNGNATSYINAAATNNGGDCASPSGLNHIWLDDVNIWWNSWGGVWGAGVDVTWPNSSPTIRGGRHTLKYTLDDNEETLESNEYDNAYTAQYVWSPYLLANHVPVSRSAPPVRGSLTYVNCDGFQFSTGGSWWGCVGILALNSGDDYDLRLHDETPTSTNGFDSSVASSGWGGSSSDFVLVNGNNGGGSLITRWAGVNRYAGGSSSFYIQLSENVGTISAPVTSSTYTLHGNDIVNMHEVYLGTATSWDFTLDNLSGSANLGFAIYNSTDTHYDKSDYEVYSNSAAGGDDESFTYTAPVTGYYGIVVFKTASNELGLQNTYQLIVELTPPNLTPDAATGWDYPVVVRDDNTASGGDVHVSVYLDGNTNNSYFNLSGINDGPNPADHNHTRFYLDDAAIWWIDWGAINGGQRYLDYNRGPFTARGGRHMVEWRNDWDEEIVELDETDNDYIRQFVWTPYALTDQVPLVRSAPPVNGWAEGFTYPNCDGFEFTWSGYWGAVGSLPANSAADFDVRLHDDPVDSQNGFDTYEAWSTAGSGYCDFVLVNGNNAGGSTGTRQAGILNYDNESGNVTLQQSNRVAMLSAPDTIGTYGLTADMVLQLFEIYFADPGHFTFALDQLSGTTNLGFTLYDAAGTYYDKYDYIANSNTGGDGQDESFTYEITSTGYYGLVVWKNSSSDYGKSCSYDLMVYLTPPNLRPYTGTGWDYPVIARNDATAVHGNAHVSPTLDGNTHNTYFSVCGINDGPNPAPFNHTRLYLDGEYFSWLNNTLPIGAGSVYFACNIGLTTVRGGRHTVLWENDWDDLVPETNETDNEYARQYVWSPSSLVDESPLARAAPPERGMGAFANCDGFQYETPAELAWATAMCPETATDDYDLVVFSDYSGSQSGFSISFGGSGLLDGELDYVGGSNTIGGNPVYPATLFYSGGAGGFVIDAASSGGGHVASVPKHWDGETLPDGRLVDVYEAYLNGGTTYEVHLTNVAGGADLQVWAHPPSEFVLVYYLAEEYWDGAGAGGHEGGSFIPAQTGWYAFVVAKKSATDVHLDVDYDFAILYYPVGVDAETPLPTSFALRQNAPNPFNPMTTIKFEVPAPGASVRLEIFDLTGQRVRTLLNETRAPGFHEVLWDGQNDAGEQMASGIYFYRLRAGDFVQTAKMTLVK